jgi:hypothetical protein
MAGKYTYGLLLVVILILSGFVIMQRNRYLRLL